MHDCQHAKSLATECGESHILAILAHMSQSFNFGSQLTRYQVRCVYGESVTYPSSKCDVPSIYHYLALAVTSSFSVDSQQNWVKFLMRKLAQPQRLLGRCHPRTGRIVIKSSCWSLVNCLARLPYFHWTSQLTLVAQEGMQGYVGT